MIHIKRSANKKFYVVVTGDNNEVLSTSELLNSKQAAWKNIEALANEFQNYSWKYVQKTVQDDTLKKKK